MVFSSYQSDASNLSEFMVAMNPYLMTMLKIGVDYPEVKQVGVICPSDVCNYLRTNTYLSFDFHGTGGRDVKLTDGEEMSVYLNAMKQVFGEDTSFWGKVKSFFSG